MINRELIRLKVVQIVYSYYQNGNQKPDVAEKELQLSMSKAYDLYNYLLLLLVEINRIAQRSFETKQSRAQRLGETTELNKKFVNNRFMLLLESNKQLKEFSEMTNRTWIDQEEFVRNLWNRIEASEYYQAYMESDRDDYDEDREIWRQIYRNFICNNEGLDSILEDMSLYWNDDKTIIDTFVLKTINRFNPENGVDQPLLPEFRDPGDEEFACQLLRRTLANSDYYYKLISDSTRNWDVERIALMDRIIMQIALAEIISFPSIPVSVSINEYVEVAKMYSTPNSGKYVNATLDHIVKKLESENKLIKNK
ncbi:MAG: transcription antitermination factor NusB [Bacteroidaceae bacterium]|jgi:N utilization substance protein B|nr:transcription antitermination factor NusB [Bacteroidaceae bacterium]MBQ2186282.1 transcription antitermination factor NusB [Bacteroidaceae bacterium]MBR3547708.1 transcription antitermination factor NusB [Bacteroidaceae bacterium]